MKRFSLKYTLKTSRLDQLWLPAAIFALFVIMSIIMKNAPQFNNVARGCLGVALPLVGGILSAYAILEDPSLELRFATPIPALQTLVEKLGMIFVIQMVLAIAFQLVHRLISGGVPILNSIWLQQLAWVIPTISLMVLGCVCALLFANPIIGSLMVGMVWLVELIAKDWFAQNNGKYFLVFMGALMPDHPDLNANLISLSVISLILFVSAVLLLRRQERFI